MKNFKSIFLITFTLIALLFSGVIASAGSQPPVRPVIKPPTREKDISATKSLPPTRPVVNVPDKPYRDTAYKEEVYEEEVYEDIEESVTYDDTIIKQIKNEMPALSNSEVTTLADFIESCIASGKRHDTPQSVMAIAQKYTKDYLTLEIIDTIINRLM